MDKHSAQTHGEKKGTIILRRRKSQVCLSRHFALRYSLFMPLTESKREKAGLLRVARDNMAHRAGLFLTMEE